MTRLLPILFLLTACAGSPDIIVNKNVTVCVSGENNRVELLYEQLSETTVEADIKQRGTLKLPLP